MVAEKVGELVRLIGHPAEDRRPGAAKEPEVVPEVLHALSPLVDVLGRRVAANVRKPLVPPAIGALEPGREQLEPGLRGRPLVDVLLGPGDDVRRPLDSQPNLGVALVDAALQAALLPLQRPSKLPQCARKLVAVALGKRSSVSALTVASREPDSARDASRRRAFSRP